MITKIFCIYDSKAEAYLQPFFMRSKGEAIRALQALVEDVQHNFCKYAADFTLFEVGSFDDSSCKVLLHDALQSICVLQELKRLPQVNNNFRAVGEEVAQQEE